MFGAAGRVRNPHRAARTIRIPKEHRNVVVHFTARNDMPYVSAQAFKIKPCNVSAQMISMSPDVNQNHRAADAHRIKPPSGGHILSGQVSLNVLKMKLADGAYRAGAYHSSSLAQHRICTVGVRKAELESGCPNLARTAYGAASSVVNGLSQTTWNPASNANEQMS